MTRVHIATATIALALSLGMASGQGVAPGATIARERPRLLGNSPLSDAHAGSLYDSVVGLLDASRKMPARIDIRKMRRATEKAPAATAEGQPLQAADAQPTVASEAKPIELGTPVVSDEELGYALFMAGRYAEAATVYRRLVEKRPDDDYLAVMLMMSERNNGNTQDMPQLLGRLRDSEETKEWAEWMEQMIALGKDSTEESE